MTALLTTARNAGLEDLTALLERQQAHKVDVVVGPRNLAFEQGRLLVDGIEPMLTTEGVTVANGSYLPTATCDEGLAAKLDVPRGYLGKMRAEAVDLYDTNLNGWLHRAPSDKRYLVRALRGDGGGGVARAFLSDGYKRVDNLDVLMATLDGVRRAGVPVVIDGCDLSERRMYVRIVSEHVRVMAPRLLHDYRSPFTGESGAENPTVFAGFVISNSEVGGGAFTLTPRLVVQVCRNGMTITRDAMRCVHLGSRLEEGVVTWSAETQQRNLDLIVSKTRDAVAEFLRAEYVEAKVDEIERAARTAVRDPQETITRSANGSPSRPSSAPRSSTTSSRAAIPRRAASCTPSPASPAPPTTPTRPTRWRPRPCAR
ncbi:DUF932 domain-containing protein [Actinomadura sp. CNU-125]|uniref:DUF932 domain-containing protein n=1 Tax=Actinomadura sp. CNU-125 TaxID=1904961 RepID=UPI000AEBDD81|nr:DUF932 domain-containing protein [Actinomadura sp. CNU-125]